MTPTNEQISSFSIQSKPKAGEDDYSAQKYMNFVTMTTDIVPTWWSWERDRELRKIWKRSDHLSSAMYTFISKIKSIPVKVISRDNNAMHRKEARQWTENINASIEFGGGWQVFISKWLEDYLGTDNGAFIEIIGRGDPSGPIQGKVLGFANLDSALCVRTGDPEYPVVYKNPQDSKRYKLHYTRVTMSSQLPSADRDMNGIGFCAVSRAIHISQNLMDISMVYQEKLGSRPTKGILMVGGGLSPEALGLSLEVASRMAEQRGYSRYGQLAIVGDEDIENPRVELINLNDIPDHFDYQTFVTISMAVLALAFGMDAKELFPQMGAGGSRADALIQHIKQRGKGPGECIAAIEQIMNYWILPPYLEFSADYQDDYQDRQAADISSKRADTRIKNIENKITDVRVEREKMVVDKEITQEQFEYMELADGRLLDGSNILSLFDGSVMVEPMASKHLRKLAIENPLNKNIHDLMEIKNAVNELMPVLMPETANENIFDARSARIAVKALEYLVKFYERDNFNEEENEIDSNVDEEELRVEDDDEVGRTINDLQRTDHMTAEDDKLDIVDETQKAYTIPAGYPSKMPPVKFSVDNYTVKKEVQEEIPFDAEGQEIYKQRVLSLVLMLGVMGNVTYFISQMTSLIEEMVNNSWNYVVLSLLGLELTDYDESQKSAIINEMTRYLGNFAEKIMEDSDEPLLDNDEIMYRSDLWANIYRDTYNKALLKRGEEENLIWVLNPDKENCVDCLDLDGLVKTAEEWDEADVYPQNRRLDCGGWNCGCHFEITKREVSDRPIPHLKG